MGSTITLRHHSFFYSSFREIASKLFLYVPTRDRNSTRDDIVYKNKVIRGEMQGTILVKFQNQTLN